jgi:hypothetical protein
MTQPKPRPSTRKPPVKATPKKGVPLAKAGPARQAEFPAAYGFGYEPEAAPDAEPEFPATYTHGYQEGE